MENREIETNSGLKRRVMLRVYMIYWKETVLSRVEYILPVLLLGGLWFCVSVPDVFANMPKYSLRASFVYLTKAMAGTEAVIQTLVIIFVASLLYLGIKRAPKGLAHRMKLLKIARV